MAMSMKEKILIVWLLVVVALGLSFSHFWVSTVYALGRAVALGHVFLPGLAKLAAGIYGVQLLP
jgi:hypothetical protein